jgi:hypothetical protein
MGRTKGSKNKRKKGLKINPVIDELVTVKPMVKKSRIISSGNIVICDKCNHRINSVSQLDLIKSTDLTILSRCPECGQLVNVTSLIVLKSFITHPKHLPVLLSEQ